MLTRAVARGTIDKESYDDALSELRDRSAAAELELQRATADDVEIDAAVKLGVRLLEDAAGLWLELSPKQKPLLQRFVYPDGLPYDGERFGTAATCGIFRAFRAAGGIGKRMVTPRGFEPLSPG